MYVQSSGFDNQGSTYFKSPNPEFGATFTYFVKEVPKTAKAIRQEKEKALFEKGDPIPQPSIAELDAESKETKPYLIFTITDESNNIVKRIFKSASKGVSRTTWNFTYESNSPVTTTKFEPVHPVAEEEVAEESRPCPELIKSQCLLWQKEKLKNFQVR